MGLRFPPPRLAVPRLAREFPPLGRIRLNRPIAEPGRPPGLGRRVTVGLPGTGISIGRKPPSARRSAALSSQGQSFLQVWAGRSPSPGSSPWYGGTDHCYVRPLFVATRGLRMRRELYEASQRLRRCPGSGQFPSDFRTHHQRLAFAAMIAASHREWTDRATFYADFFRPLDGGAELARLRAIAACPSHFVELPSREHAEAGT
jgi:hypothetical protein